MTAFVLEGIIGALDIDQEYPLPVDCHPLHLARLEVRSSPNRDELGHAIISSHLLPPCGGGFRWGVQSGVFPPPIPTFPRWGGRGGNACEDDHRGTDGKA